VGGHVKERARKAKVAISRIQKPQLLSMESAQRVFELCIAPVATYGIAVVWERMTKNMLETMESVKATFLKRCLGAAVGTKNRLVYRLVGTGSFVMDKFGLPGTTASSEYLVAFSEKMRQVIKAGELLGSPAMTSDAWRESGRPGRSLIIRVSLHGLHSDFCSGRRCFSAQEYCVCRFCGGQCEQHHVWSCPSSEGVEQRKAVKLAEKSSVGLAESDGS